jgi:hypothetical protein
MLLCSRLIPCSAAPEHAASLIVRAERAHNNNHWLNTWCTRTHSSLIEGKTESRAWIIFKHWMSSSCCSSAVSQLQMEIILDCMYMRLCACSIKNVNTNLMDAAAANDNRECKTARGRNAIGLCALCQFHTAIQSIMEKTHLRPIHYVCPWVCEQVSVQSKEYWVLLGKGGNDCCTRWKTSYKNQL